MLMNKFKQEVQDLYTITKHLKEIKDLDKWENILCSWSRRLYW